MQLIRADKMSNNELPNRTKIQEKQNKNISKNIIKQNIKCVHALSKLAGIATVMCCSAFC